MSKLRNSVERRTVLALALSVLFGAGASAYTAKFQDCFIDDARCTQYGANCYVEALNCASCSEDPNECWIYFDDCSEFNCGECAGGCQIIIN